MPAGFYGSQVNLSSAWAGGVNPDLAVHDKVHRIGSLSLHEKHLARRNIENFCMFRQGTKLFQAQTC
jgi:hypothetical protein